MAHYLTLLFAILLSRARVPVGPDELIKGMTLIRSSSQYPYNSPVAESALTQMVSQTHPNLVVILPVWWMSDTGTTRIFWRAESSPSDKEIEHIVNYAHRLGLKVFLKPELRCVSKTAIRFHDPPDTFWFTAYRRFILHYARLANKTGCELFALGTDLDRTADEPWEIDQWQKTIKLTKRLFRSRTRAPLLTYAAGWRTWRNIPFWDQLDYIGINAFFPLESKKPPLPFPEFRPGGVDYLAWFWKSKYLPEIEDFLNSLNQPRPVLFTGIGYRSVSRTYEEPENDTLHGDYDPGAQRNCYIAAYHALGGKPWFAGWCFQGWETDTSAGGVNHTGYTPRGKIAAEVARRFNLTLSPHKGFCFPTTYDSTYFYPRTFRALDSLKAMGANWVAINSRWLLRDTGLNWTYLKPLFGESPADRSIEMVIDYAHARGLAVALYCYIACSTRVWCGLHNPGADTAWFKAESAYVVQRAKLAEKKRVEMLTIGLEINQTMDSPQEARLWRHKVLPAVRQLYCGPLAYGASWSPVHDYFWDGIDICGIHPYYPLVEPSLYLGKYPLDTSINQRPQISDITTTSRFSWEGMRKGELQELYERIQKPILFTEIGYRSLDSTALHPSWDYWYGWQARTLTPHHLHSVCFPVDTMTGYIVGDSGIIFKTTNSGQDWKLCASGTNQSLYSVAFPVRDTGYACGDSGVVIKTDNGFASYQRLTTGFTNTFYSLCFPVDPRSGYLVGEQGIILKTTDGGNHWHRQFCILPSGETLRFRLRTGDFVTESVGYIAGDSGTLLKTTDAGNFWHLLNLPVKVNLQGVDFIALDTGLVVGDSGIMLLTTDGGNNWKVYKFRTGEWDLLSVSVPEYDSARFVCGTKGMIIRAGDAWQFNGSVQHTPIRRTLRSIQLRPVPQPGYYELVGFAVGDSGTVLKTSTGGRMRVDFNEQANCYQAAFQTFWGNPEKPKPLPWFYGFHFWKWETDPEPMDIEHELVIDDYTPQGKKAGEVVRQWFKW